MNKYSEILGPEPWELKHADLETPCEIEDRQRLSSRLCGLCPTTAAELRSRGIECANGESLGAGKCVLDRVEDLLRIAPRLDPVVRSCVREIVLLQISDDAYDISHSEPRWPYRIFISIPGPSRVQDLRVAEAVVHEAMHLILTNFERVAPLASDERTLKSPWRSELRPAAGVLHGIYVFCCISRFLRHLDNKSPLGACAMEHVQHRQAEIAAQLDSIDFGALRMSLTSEGINLLDELF